MSISSEKLGRVQLQQIGEAISSITPRRVHEYEARGEHPTELFRSVLAAGIANLILDKDAPPGSHWDFCSIITEISEKWLGLGESVHYQVLATCALAQHGTPGQKDKYLNAMASGFLIAANCFNEPNAGSDFSAMETTATKVADGFIINGEKKWIGHAPIADIYNVYAKTRDAGLAGITCFLVPGDSSGLTITPRAKAGGAACLISGDVRFDGVHVSEDAVVGRVNRGIIAGQDLFTQGRVGLAACANGLSRAALRRASEYASTRVQFGKTINQFQGIAFPLAEVSTELAASEALLQRACTSLERRDQDANLLAAQAKLKAASCARATTDVAIKTLASQAFDETEPALRWSAEAHLLEIIQGTAEMQKIAISSWIK